MPDHRRDALVAAVAAYNRSHKPLPNSTVRLLEVMFASGDVCQLSLQVLEDVTGLSLRVIQTVLRALLAAGIIAKEETGQGRHANRYRLLLTAGSGA
jgi:DNA-binding transcriptional ArsR family regulator